MQALTFACSILFVILDFAQGQNQDDNGSSLYTRRYEHLDVDTILASPRLVSNYVECLLNKKPCAPEGKALKRILPEALRTKCSRCWPSQKEGALKVITSLYFNYPQYYQALREKWDPTGEYNRRFEEYLRDQKFNAIGSDSEVGEQAQRPIRQGEVSSTVQEDELPDISNRFGADDESGYAYNIPSTSLPSIPGPTQRPQTARKQPQRPQTAQKPQRPQPAVQSEQPQQAPISSTPPRRQSNSQSSGSASQPESLPSNPGSNSANTPTHMWNYNNLPAPGLSPTTTYYLKTQNPVLNIISRITMKFANTAEFIAGMLRAAVPSPKLK